MWGRNESTQTKPPTPAAAPPPVRPVEEHRPAPPPPVERASRAILGKSLILKAQISGAEDLFVDGQLEGAIELKGHNLTIGSNGKVKADVVAKNVYVEGTLEGNVQAGEKIEIRKTGSLRGDLTTAGVTIEDGAYFKGSIDIIKKPADGKGK
jgi:cytoskeletal protein CcmA (bactofilin family)